MKLLLLSLLLNVSTQFSPRKLKLVPLQFAQMNKILDESLYICESKMEKEDLTDLYSDLNDAKSYLVRQIEDKRLIYYALQELTTSYTETIIIDPVLYLFVKIHPDTRSISIEFILKFQNSEISSEIITKVKRHLMSIGDEHGYKLDYNKLKDVSNGKWFLEFLIQN